MFYKFFTNSKKTWQAMFESIKRAQSSIYLEMYIFSDDVREFNFVKLLKEKAESGIRVKIILDSFGSSELHKSVISGLKNAGVEVLFFSKFLHRTHRKILVVDEKEAFFGGVNIKQNMHHWIDLAFSTTGKLAKNASRSFAKAYVLCGGKDEELISLSKKVVSYKTKTWLIEHFPVSKKFKLKKIYKEELRMAEKNVFFASPYFIPRRWLMGAMHQAVLRGVRVEVLVPKVTNHFIIDRVNYFNMFKMSKLGIIFYLHPKMNHAKTMIIDSKEGIIGSQNIDFLSFEFNNEIGVFTKDEKAIRDLLAIAKQWKSESILFDPGSHKPKWIDYILFPIIRLLFFP